MKHKDTVVLGAGPAGCAAADELLRHGISALILEKETEAGGLCRTLEYLNYRFDIGGHRFLTKSEEVESLWREVMGDDLLVVKRLSRIFFKKNFFNYPLSFWNTFNHLGFIESVHCVCSYFWARFTRPGNEETFEGWITNRFGKRLYEIFFKSYTEKVWEIACKDISADWAQQRIRGLSLRVALNNIFHLGEHAPKTLAEQFLYPRTGPGEFYERFSKRIEDKGSAFEFSSKVETIELKHGKVDSVRWKNVVSGERSQVKIKNLFSSIPLPMLIKMMRPLPEQKILAAADSLKFRSFLIVNVILSRANLFPDQWIYVQDPDVRMGRIQNYKNWSPGMVPDLEKTSLGLEYFCTKNDALWMMNDVNLIEFAMKELEHTGLASRKDLVSGYVVRRANVYPIYDLTYQENIDTLREYIEKIPNLATMGRHGLFHYDNSDHALLSGFYAVRRYLGDATCNEWEVNIDQKYLES